MLVGYEVLVDLQTGAITLAIQSEEVDFSDGTGRKYIALEIVEVDDEYAPKE